MQHLGSIWLTLSKCFGIVRMMNVSRKAGGRIRGDRKAGKVRCSAGIAVVGTAGSVLQEMGRQRASALGHQDQSTAGMRNSWASYQGIGKLQDAVLTGDFYYPDICWVTNAANHGNNAQP